VQSDGEDGRSAFSGFTMDATVARSPNRRGPSVRDARARLWEFLRAKEFAHLIHAALVTAVPRDDDATLSPKQREGLRENRAEIVREADDVGMRVHTVTNPRKRPKRC